MAASLNGHDRVVELLLNNWANPDIQDNVSGKTSDMMTKKRLLTIITHTSQQCACLLYMCPVNGSLSIISICECVMLVSMIDSIYSGLQMFIDSYSDELPLS